MINIRNLAFQKALGIHKKLKRVPYYSKLYPRAKSLLPQKLVKLLGIDIPTTIEKQQATNFCTHYEESPLKPSVIVYEAFHGSSVACGPAAIYETARSDLRFSGYQHIWVIDEPATVPIAFAGRSDTRVIKRDSSEYSELLATAKYLVNNSTFPAWYTRRDGQIYVNTWHGTPLKTMFRDERGTPAGFANSQRNFLQATHIFMSSDFATEHLLGSAGIAQLCSTKTWQLGTPRLDRTLNARQRWKPTVGRREILFAPTWKGAFRGDANSHIGEIETVVGILREAGGGPLTLNVKAHNFSPDNILNISRLSSEGLTVKAVDPRTDINDEMARMDAIISDYSSLIFDALAANIPVLLFVPDFETYSTVRGLYLELKNLPLTVCHDGSELVSALKYPRPAKDFDSADVARSTYYPDEDAHATARALDVMLGAETAQEPLARAAKPIITMMAGGWRRNGIATSALNLLSNIDLETYNVVVLTDGRRLSAEAWLQISAVRPEIMFVHRLGHEGFTRSEMRVKTAFYHSNTFTDPADSALMRRAMRREARRIIGELQPVASIDFSGYRRLWAWIMAMMNADKKFIFQHNDMLSEKNNKYPELRGVFHVYQYYDQIVAVSEETRALNFSNLGNYYSEDKTLALRNTLNLNTIQKAMQKKPYTFVTRNGGYTVLDLTPLDGGDVVNFKAIPAIDPSVTNFITIGRASDEKNHAMLLRAFKILLQTQPEAHLYILGDGPLLKDTRTLRDSLGLRGHVTLPGFSDSALYLLGQCDCFVLPSLYEGQPMVILEALTLEIPVIVTDIAGSRSALQGGYGHIVEGPVSAVSFAEAMNSFCRRELTFETFSADLYNAQAVAALHAMLSENGVGG